MKSAEYLREIREAGGLKNAVLVKIEAAGGEITFRLHTDSTYTDADVEHARAVTARYMPAGYRAEVKIMKSVPNADTVRTFLLDKLKTMYPAAAAFVSPEDVSVQAGKGGGSFTIGSAADRVSDEIADALCRETARNFCGSWTGELLSVKKDLGDIVPAETAEEYVMQARFFPVTEYVAIDGASPKEALYLADLNSEAKGIAVCGMVNYVEERVTKAGKPFFLFTVSDGTSQIRASYFSRKSTLEKVRSVKQGDYICLTGDNELYNGTLSFRAKDVDFGRPPQNFVPVMRPSRPVPAQYKAVFPVSAEIGRASCRERVCLSV